MSGYLFSLVFWIPSVYALGTINELGVFEKAPFLLGRSNSSLRLMSKDQLVVLCIEWHHFILYDIYI